MILFALHVCQAPHVKLHGEDGLPNGWQKWRLGQPCQFVLSWLRSDRKESHKTDEHLRYSLSLYQICWQSLLMEKQAHPCLRLVLPSLHRMESLTTLSGNIPYLFVWPYGNEVFWRESLSDHTRQILLLPAKPQPSLSLPQQQHCAPDPSVSSSLCQNHLFQAPCSVPGE